MTTDRGKLTVQRREALRRIAADSVRYDPCTADYLIDGQPVGGWDWRTLSGLVQAGFAQRPRGRTQGPVRLTRAGEDALSAPGSRASKAREKRV